MWILFLILLLIPNFVYGQSIYVLGSGKPFKVNITDAFGGALTGKTLTDVDVYYTCSGDTETQFNETGDTLTEIDATITAGRYWYATNDIMTGTCATGDEIQVCVIGANISGRCVTYKVAAQEINIVTQNQDKNDYNLAADQGSVIIGQVNQANDLGATATIKAGQVLSFTVSSTTADSVTATTNVIVTNNEYSAGSYYLVCGNFSAKIIETSAASDTFFVGRGATWVSPAASSICTVRVDAGK